MIIKWPECKQGHADDGYHYNLDLIPTLADLFDAKPSERWDGLSYAETITNGEDTGRDYLVLSQCAHVCQRSVLFDNWLYMRTYHDGFHLFPKEMLFNIEDDPREMNNLASERPDMCAKAAHTLYGWHDDMMATQSLSTINNFIDPLWQVIYEGGPLHAKGHLPKYTERLADTGRGWAVDELKKRHPREFE